MTPEQIRLAERHTYTAEDAARDAAQSNAAIFKDSPDNWKCVAEQRANSFRIRQEKQP